MVHQNRVTILEIATPFYVQKPLNILPLKSRHGCKNRGTLLTVLGPKSAFQKVRIPPFRA